ncbi:MAG TPA: response regulator [Opitutaceae bacterium]|nr:response regulator [Opitutaceae bacterium]
MSEPKNILLAEDNPLDIEMTLNALQTNHLVNEVVVVRNGAEALDYLYARGAYAHRVAGDPALVLLDIKMPKVDGLEVLHCMKNDAKLRSIPVVMLTSSREESDLLQSYKLGTNAYVVKPVDFSSFIEAVTQLSIFWTVHNELPPRVAREAE